jgi:hypothetical protein
MGLLYLYLNKNAKTMGRGGTDKIISKRRGSIVNIHTSVH